MNTRKPADPRSQLLKELHLALEQVDEPGLLFLLRQAQVLIHNARVDEINQQAASKAEPGAQDPVAATAARPALSTAADAVSVEGSPGGTVFFLVIGKLRKSMDQSEVDRLVRICRDPSTKAEAAEQLYRVLKQERRDILTDAGIRSASSPILGEIYKAVQSWRAAQA